MSKIKRIMSKEVEEALIRLPAHQWVLFTYDKIEYDGPDLELLYEKAKKDGKDTSKLIAYKTPDPTMLYFY